MFKAKAVDVGATSVTFEMTGTPSKVNDFLELMRPYGLIDVVKSGWIALSRDSKTRNLRAISWSMQSWHHHPHPSSPSRGDLPLRGDRSAAFLALRGPGSLR